MIDFNNHLNKEYVADIRFSKKGNAYVTIENDLDIFIHKKNIGTAFHFDTVRIEIFQYNGEIEGKVIEIVQRNRTIFTGVIHKNKETIFIVPDNSRLPDFWLGKIPKKIEIKDKQRVLFKFVKWDQKSPEAKIEKVLGEIGNNDAEINSIMYQYNLPIEFPIDVLRASNELKVDLVMELLNREDLRNLTTFTIDPIGAKDYDDALSIEPFEDGFKVGIHIADVSHFVRKNSIIDEEALNRGNSTYLVDRTIPMLPESLSNGLCSLRPGEDKLTFSVILTLDKNFDITNTWFGKTIINSNKRYTYEEVEEILNGVDDVYSNEINHLNEMAKYHRNKRGSLRMNSIEVRFILDEVTKKPIDVELLDSLDSHKLIEEFMLLANKHVGILLKEYNCIYRVHDEPNDEKIAELKVICDEFGYEVDVDDIKNSLNQLMEDIKDQPEENLINTMIVKSMNRAKYSTNNVGHYGLGFEYYAHFTAPIRRYNDLIVHRKLNDFLNKKPIKNVEDLEDIAKWLSSKENESKQAERDSIKYKQIEYLSTKIGEKFQGVISSVRSLGFYVELIDNKCEGFVNFNTMTGSWISYQDKQLVSNGYDTLRLGDVITIEVVKCDLLTREIDFKYNNEE